MSVLAYANQLVWGKSDNTSILVRTMGRDQIRDALQLLSKTSSDYTKVYKDGLTYAEWIAIFTIKLLDPTVE